MSGTYTVSGVLLSGTHAARPAANTVAQGCLYSETDTFAIFQSDGTNWNAWGPAQTASGLVLLEKHTASSSATLDFTTSLSATYDEYIIELVQVLPATLAAALWTEVSQDGGVTWDTAASSYSYSNANWNGAFASEINTLGHMVLSSGAYNVSPFGIYGQLRFYLTNRSWWVGQVGYLNNAPTRAMTLVNGDYETAGTPNALRFLFSTGNIASGTVRIYGVAKT